MALSSGGARGLAHLGVLKALREKDVQIRAIAGSSIGSLIGAYYCLKGEIDSLIRIAHETDWRRLLGLLDINPLTLSRGGLLEGKRIEQFLKELFADATFSDCGIPLVVVATDLRTGRAVEISEGPLWKAVRASIGIPGLLSPVEMGSYLLTDGGVASPIPVITLKKRGYRPIWAVNVLASTPRYPVSRQQLGVLEVLEQSLLLMENIVAKTQSQLADGCIEVDTSDVPFYDFTKAKDLIPRGETVAHRYL